VVDLSSSSDEGDIIPDTSHDFEFTQHLYGELNRALLGSPGDGKIIILSDSDEEEEESEETIVDDKVAPSTADVQSLAPASSAANADEDPGKRQDDNSDGLAPGQDTGKSSDSGDKAGLP
jgi:hypothetical protein